MKKQGSLFTGIVLLTVVFLAAACTTTAAKVQQGNEASVGTSDIQKNPAGSGVYTPTAMATKGATTPVNNITLPVQTAVQPSPVASKTQPGPTPVPTGAKTNGGGNVGQPSISQAAQAVFVLINQERASMNLPALQMSNALINSAHLHNVAMLAAN